MTLFDSSSASMHTTAVAAPKQTLEVDVITRQTCQSALDWLFFELLPLWGSVGHDHVHGGFFEQIALDGEAVLLPKRCRVQARQLFTFLTAGRLGWNGPWRALADSGIRFMLTHHRRPDGSMRFKTHIDGSPYDDRVDNYDQAFAIFALAHAFAVDRDEYCHRAALGVLEVLRRERSHPDNGFYEQGSQDTLLHSNPHMHIFEGALAWLDIAPHPEWRALAQEVGNLCVRRFIDPHYFALREYFASDWSPAPGDRGRIVEPGHQFEWAWLLARWRAHGGDVDLKLIRALYGVGNRAGVAVDRHLVVNELWIEGGVKDGGSRLWQQAERMKAALSMAELFPDERAIHEAEALDSWVGMQTFLVSENRGLFKDKLCSDGSFIPEGALASSLYHVICALSELKAYCDKGTDRS